MRERKRYQRSYFAPVFFVALAGTASAQIRITEYMYTGPDGEFVELTNVGGAAIDMTGWSYDDNSGLPGTFDLSAFGVVNPGESVVITDSTEAAFRAAWGLALSVDILGGSGVDAGLGRADTINVYDAADALADQLQYDDQTFIGSIRTQNPSGWVCSEGLGANDIFQWNLSVLADVQNSFLSSGGALGSPGSHVDYACGATPTGACCTAGVCSDPVTQVDCEIGGGGYQGDGSACPIACPPPSDGDVRITEYMYTGGSGEYIEFTNFDVVPVDMTGWSFDDDSGIAGTVFLSGLGTLMPGQSGILTELPAASFIANWGLVGVPVVGGSTAGLGRNDQINLFNASGVLKDQLTYGDENFLGTIRTQNRSGWPCDDATGQNDIFQWQYSEVGDSQGSYVSPQGDVGNPGTYTAIACIAIPTGACCDTGVCTDLTATECIFSGGNYQGDVTDCGSFNCPAPSSGLMRITEYMYSSGSTGGEYIEFTNMGANPIDMTGWSYDDDSNVPGTVLLSSFGVVMPGQSVILTESTVADFNAHWSLAGVAIVGENTVNIGRTDTIHLYDSMGALADKIQYSDQTFLGTIRTQGASGWPCEDAVGANDIFLWRLSANADVQNSYASSNGDIGNPGTFVLFDCIGACCTNGVCVENVAQQDCTAGGGIYNGDLTTCGGDADGDGVDASCGDECPDDPAKLVPGQCGCGTPDTDTDGDGTADCNDGCPNDPGKIAPGICGCGTPDDDTDGDGTADCEDGCPNDPNKIDPGQCGCGNPDTDTDGDGTADCNDGCPNDPAKIAPGLCGCGVADDDTDGDGTPDCNDGCPNDPAKIDPGQCGCGNADTDTDGDGTADCNDGCPNDAAKIAPGQCGCGTPDDDNDADGTANCNDGCPDDPNKVDPGICGCGAAETGDTDGDGVLDCNDVCPGVDDAVFAPGCVGAIPTVSEWGMVILALLLATAGKIAFSRRVVPS